MSKAVVKGTFSDAVGAGIGGPADWVGGWDHRSMYGLRVRSAVPLPDWPAAEATGPDLVIELEPFEGPASEGEPYAPHSTVRDGVVRIEVRGVARYTIPDGSRVRVAIEAEARPDDVRLYLTGAVVGVVLHHRGILPLHASCVAVAGRGVAFAAPSGSGKSTIASALLRRGATFVSDDICALTPVEAGETRVWPSASRFKLDPPAIASLTDADPTGLEETGGNCGKFHVPVDPARVSPEPVPLARIYRLEYGEGEPRIEPLRRVEAVSTLLEETYMIPFAASMGYSPRIFRAVAELANVLQVQRLIRPRGFEHVDHVVELIEQDVAG